MVNAIHFVVGHMYDHHCHSNFSLILFCDLDFSFPYSLVSSFSCSLIVAGLLSDLKYPGYGYVIESSLTSFQVDLDRKY